MQRPDWKGDEKRSLHNLRRMIDDAPPIEKATLRMLARMLSVDQLRPVDATLGRLRGPGGNGGTQG